MNKKVFKVSLEKYGIEKPKFQGEAPMVVVGMSGGVDSSVAAYILKWQGYNVVGLFMKNWEEKDNTGICTSEADFADVKRVSEALGIPYYSVNFSKQYMEQVFKQFLDGLEKGFTPNPDILCNREIKFGPFLQYAKKMGAEYIATGHYCQVENGILKKGVDEGKDQSYFLCGLSQKQLENVLFPVGGLKKETVREIAEALGLSTAKKKDSTGICFIGERNFRDFMKTYLGNQSGPICTLDGKVVGHHEGTMYYTLGQRKGLGIGGTTENTDRWFVVRKDLATNTIFVNNGDCDQLYTSSLVADSFNFIPNKEAVAAVLINCLKTGKTLSAKTRYRQPDQMCDVELLKDGTVEFRFRKPQRAVTPGQWVVLYNGENCLGGGQIMPANS